MEISKDKIEALKYVKNIFSFQSDYSTQCNGYSSLLGLIEAAEKEYSEEKYQEYLRIMKENPEPEFINKDYNEGS